MKYRQRGYRDTDWKERRDRDHTDEREARQEARKTRHAVSRESTVVVRCADCGHQSAGQIAVAFDTACEGCQAPLHNCRNCRHFDTQARFQCRQPIPERLMSKTDANE